MLVTTFLVAVLLQSITIDARLNAANWPTTSPLQSPALLRALLRARSSSFSPSPVSSATQPEYEFISISPSVSPFKYQYAPKKGDLSASSAFVESNSIDIRSEPEVIALPFTLVQGPTRFPLPPVLPGQQRKIVEGVGPAVSFPAPNQPSNGAKGKSDDELSVSDETSSEQSQASELHPVYIKPPTNFKPVLYANRQLDGHKPSGNPSIAVSPPLTHNQQNQPLPYPYPNGLSSWMLGGLQGVQRGGYWEQLGSDQALHSPSSSSSYPSNTRLTPASQSVWYVQSIRDADSKTETNRPMLDKVELVSLGDQEVGDKDVYDASPSTIHQTSVRLPSTNQIKFLIDSKQDLMMSASQSQYKRF